jgi:hypothetical protein
MVSSRVNCCWFSPALLFLVPSPAGLTTIFQCLMALGVVQLTLCSLVRYVLHNLRPRVRCNSNPKVRHFRAFTCLPPAFTLVSCSSYFSTLKIEQICSSEKLKSWLTFYGLHGVISQKMVLFITTAVRT